MYNVDTLTLSMTFIRYRKKRFKGKKIIVGNYKSHNIKKNIKKKKRELDYKYILECDTKIKSKLILEDKDRKIKKEYLIEENYL